MPIYEYTCKSCKNQFEKLVKSMSSSAGVKCPECGSAQTARNLSVFAVASRNEILVIRTGNVRPMRRAGAVRDELTPHLRASFRRRLQRIARDPRPILFLHVADRRVRGAVGRRHPPPMFCGRIV